MMKSVTTVLEDWLVAQGMHDRTVGAGKVVVNKGPALSTMASGGEVLADAAGGDEPHRPTAGGGVQPMRKRKSPGTAGAGSEFNSLGEKPKEPTPAHWRVLKLVVDNSRCMPLRPTRSAERGSGIHLVFSK